MTTDIFESPPAAAATKPNPELARAFVSIDAHPVAPIVRPEPTQTVHAARPSDPMALVHMAVEKGYDEVRLQRIIDMGLQLMAVEQRKALIRALVAFKATDPQFLKNAHVAYENAKKQMVEYDHATLASITRKLNVELSPFGLSLSWNPKTIGPSRVEVTTILEHVDGGSRSVTLEADFDTSGSKNGIQGQGSAIAYLERYGSTAVLGVATEGQDDDGRATAAANAAQIVGENILDKLLAQLRTTTTDEAAAAVWKIGRDSIDATKNTQAADEFRAAVLEHRKALKQRRAA